MQPVAPLRGVLFKREAQRGIVGKPGRNVNRRSSTKKAQGNLVADAHAAASQQRNEPRQVSACKPLRVVEFAARWAQLMIEVMDPVEALLADIAHASEAAFRVCALQL